ncbi:hypothetical protein OEZ86_013372 [Tetradesmus obliquus]|nr:hypothetical protein OEZ86_013372 [Tetradesmus obliquus]
MVAAGMMPLMQAQEGAVATPAAAAGPAVSPVLPQSPAKGNTAPSGPATLQPGSRSAPGSSMTTMTETNIDGQDIDCGRGGARCRVCGLIGVLEAACRRTPK